jgi:hypothetical protein
VRGGDQLLPLVAVGAEQPVLARVQQPAEDAHRLVLLVDPAEDRRQVQQRPAEQDPAQHGVERVEERTVVPAEQLQRSAVRQRRLHPHGASRGKRTDR